MTTFAQLGSVTLIMPTLNEAGHIADLIRDSVTAMRGAGVSGIEILVMDDDSQDETWKIAGEVKCEGAEIRVVRRLADHGLTPSLREGIQQARHEIVVWMDCDYSHPPERIPQMLYMLAQGYDVAVNSRYTVGGGESRSGKGGTLQRWLSGGLNWSIRFMLRPSFADYTSGFVAVRREVLMDIPLRGDYGEYFVDFIYRALRRGKRVCELPYMAPPRRSGESKTGTNLFQYLRRGRKYLATVGRLHFEVLSRKI